MKRNKGIVALTVTMIAAFVLAACGSNSGNQDAEKGEPSSAPTAAGSSVSDNGKDAQADPVKFTIMLSAPPSFNTENNPWIEEINKRANAEITWLAVPLSNIWEKRNVTMASNSYPDVIMMNPPNDQLYASMVKNKVLLPLDELIANAPNLSKYTSKQALDAVRDPDGHLYMVPRSTIVREDFMAIRKDWLEKLGLTTPATTDDWRTYYKDAAAKDPDGNGKPDTYGTTESAELLSLNGTVNMEFFARAWHADKLWYDNGQGELSYGVFAKDGRFKHVLEFYQALQSDHAIDPDMLTNKGAPDKITKFETGITASMRTFAGNLDRSLNAIQKIDANAQVELVDFPTAPESDQYKDEKPVLTNAGIYNAWALTSAAKGKEQRIIDVLDWLLSDEGWNILVNGVEGVHYNKDGDQIIHLPAFDDFATWSGYTMLFRRANSEDLWLKNIVPEIRPYQKEWLDKSVLYMQEQYVPDGLIGLTSQQEQDFYKKDIYTKEYPEIVAKIIYGQLPVSAWDGFLDKVYAAGWDAVTQEYNEYYQGHK